MTIASRLFRLEGVGVVLNWFMARRLMALPWMLGSCFRGTLLMSTVVAGAPASQMISQRCADGRDLTWRRDKEHGKVKEERGSQTYREPSCRCALGFPVARWANAIAPAGGLRKEARANAMRFGDSWQRLSGKWGGYLAMLTQRVSGKCSGVW